MKATSYTYDGIAKIRCRKCGKTHDIDFAGSDLETVDEAINKRLDEDNWDIHEAVCPDCNDCLDDSLDCDELKSIDDSDFYDTCKDHEQEYSFGDEEWEDGYGEGEDEDE
jgi:hypothetical protein